VQHKVLFWGVVGALVFRLVFIFVGAELLETFFWTAYLFGAFLIWTGYKMAFRHGEQSPPDRNPLVRLVRRIVPTDPHYHGDRFFVRIDGTRTATLLFVVLVAVETTDLIFAVDSVAAILAITTDEFIVWTANAFAILGLRSLYFCLAGLLRRFVHLHYGLAVLLAFAGVKLVLSETPVGKLPIPLTLGVIVVTIGVSILWSVLATRGDTAERARERARVEAVGESESRVSSERSRDMTARRMLLPDRASKPFWPGRVGVGARTLGRSSAWPTTARRTAPGLWPVVQRRGWRCRCARSAGSPGRAGFARTAGT
jgi:predicted tellurium resistance membrane protein TerC